MNSGTMTVYVVLGALIAACLLTCACTDSSGQAAPVPTTAAGTPEISATTVVAGQPVSFTGVVSDRGRLQCPCFSLTNGSKSIFVRTDLDDTSDKTKQLKVQLGAVHNGDTVTVTGQWESDGKLRPVSLYQHKAAAPATTATAEIAAAPTVGAILTLPADAESVDVFMTHRAYETKVSLTGQAISVGELDCPCFVLTDDGTNLRVWYDMKVLPGGTSEPAVSIRGLKSGSRVLVTGMLKSGSDGGTRNEFWASEIVKVVG